MMSITFKVLQVIGLEDFDVGMVTEMDDPWGVDGPGMGRAKGLFSPLVKK